MEASTVPAIEESTGSKTIADMMAAAAGKFGDDFDRRMFVDYFPKTIHAQNA